MSAAGRDPARPFTIGLTGPIGCGKSTVARMLARLGGLAIDADAEARAATAPGAPALAPIAARFGPGIVRDGVLDRAALARIVFADPAALADLEALVHPAVRARILAALAGPDAEAAPFVVVEAIKLVEGGLAALCDEVWLIACAPGTQRARLTARGMEAADAERRIAAQGDLAERLAARADRVVRTDGSEAETEARVEAALAEALVAVMTPFPIRPDGARGGPGR
ncbi:MAG: dephospho-CoA kinase [Chloroflexota bacterium]